MKIVLTTPLHIIDGRGSKMVTIGMFWCMTQSTSTNLPVEPCMSVCVSSCYKTISLTGSLLATITDLVWTIMYLVDLYKVVILDPHTLQQR